MPGNLFSNTNICHFNFDISTLVTVTSFLLPRKRGCICNNKESGQSGNTQYFKVKLEDGYKNKDYKFRWNEGKRLEEGVKKTLLLGEGDVSHELVSQY